LQLLKKTFNIRHIKIFIIEQFADTRHLQRLAQLALLALATGPLTVSSETLNLPQLSHPTTATQSHPDSSRAAVATFNHMHTVTRHFSMPKPSDKRRGSVPSRNRSSKPQSA